jgi:2-polyprenyl-3-methyl-5-hydroxy-6-metoxy-1,4-benzoquinol methylase
MKDGDPIRWHSTIAESFDAGYADKPDFRERLAVWTDLIARHSSPGHQVLDIGCGSGVFSMVAASRNAEVIGVDASPEMIRLANAKGTASNLRNVAFLVGNVLSLGPLALPPADLVICSSLLEYVDDPDAALDALASLLKPGGTLLVSMPNKRSIFRRMEPILFRLTGRPRYYRFVRSIGAVEELAAKLAQRGMKITERAFFSPTPWLSAVLRPLGLARYTDNLFVVTARRAE